jgi:hypothetical protein
MLRPSERIRPLMRRAAEPLRFLYNRADDAQAC